MCDVCLKIWDGGKYFYEHISKVTFQKYEFSFSFYFDGMKSFIKILADSIMGIRIRILITNAYQINQKQQKFCALSFKFGGIRKPASHGMPKIESRKH